MRDVETLRRFAAYQAAELWAIGFSTNIFDVSETSTELIARRVSEKQLLLFPVIPVHVGSGLPADVSEIEITEPARHDGPSSDFRC